MTTVQIHATLGAAHGARHLAGTVCGHPCVVHVANTSHSSLWSVLVVQVVASVSIVVVAAFTAWAASRRDLVGRRAVSELEALRELVAAATAFRAAARAAGVDLGQTPEVDVQFDETRARFHVATETVRSNSVRTTAAAWERLAEKAFSLDPQHPSAQEKLQWEALMTDVGLTMRETYRGRR